MKFIKVDRGIGRIEVEAKLTASVRFQWFTAIAAGNYQEGQYMLPASRADMESLSATPVSGMPVYFAVDDPDAELSTVLVWPIPYSDGGILISEASD